MARICIGLVGAGKIARDQHIPVITANPAFKLAACTTRGEGLDGLDSYETVEAMLADHPEIEAVAIATPTVDHYYTAKAALLAGRHVLIEKPPCATNAQFDRLVALSARAKRSLFQTWHLRFAPRVVDTKKWLRNRPILGGRIVWKENVHDCHPGQAWIWQRGGFGVFDPGINAISILIQILPEPVFVERAELFYPSNLDCPIAAEIEFRTDSGIRIEATMDFAYQGKPAWDIRLDTEHNRLDLTGAATRLAIDGQPQTDGAEDVHAEYRALYTHFAALIAKGESDVDAAPLRLVADVFLLAKHTTVGPFSG